MKGYVNALGFLVWPLIFSAVIGYVYLKNQSAVAAAAVALIIMCVFSSVLTHPNNGLWYSLMYILISLVITGLLLIFLTKVRR